MADQSMWNEIVKKVGGGKSNGAGAGDTDTYKPHPIKLGTNTYPGSPNGGAPSGDTDNPPTVIPAGMPGAGKSVNPV